MTLSDDWNLSFTEADFCFLAGLVRDQVGIELGPKKRDMIYARLSKRVRLLGLSSFADYCALLSEPEGKHELGAAVNAITTNLTRFFREPHHFEHFQQVVIPHALSRRGADLPQSHGGRRLRVWSAGCSSGEEPYSIAISLLQALHQGCSLSGEPIKLPSGGAITSSGVTLSSSLAFQILATDIDTDILHRAARGNYSSADLERVPPALRDQAFEARGDGTFSVRESLRKMIDFKRLNLIDRWPMQRPFDAIFCRNVAIYFSRPLQRRLFERMADLLVPDGILYIGHSENLFGVSDRFHLVARTVYRKIGA